METREFGRVKGARADDKPVVPDRRGGHCFERCVESSKRDRKHRSAEVRAIPGKRGIERSVASFAPGRRGILIKEIKLFIASTLNPAPCYISCLRRHRPTSCPCHLFPFLHPSPRQSGEQWEQVPLSCSLSCSRVFSPPSSLTRLIARREVGESESTAAAGKGRNNDVIRLN